MIDSHFFHKVKSYGFNHFCSEAQVEATSISMNIKKKKQGIDTILFEFNNIKEPCWCFKNSWWSPVSFWFSETVKEKPLDLQQLAMMQDEIK